MNVRLLFLGWNESGRCRLAAALARACAAPGVEIACATIEPAPADDGRLLAAPDAVPAAGPCPMVDALGVREFDLVVVCGDRAGGRLPMLPGRPTTVTWTLADPAAFGGDAAGRREQAAALRDRLRHLVADLFDQGYLEAIARLRANGFQILDAISDGVLAHDLQRRIVFFNRAAEVITGHKRGEVIGRDCHEVFGCGFCGGKCVLNGPVSAEPGFEERCERIDTVTAQGESRTVEALVRPLRDAENRWAGLVLAFHDVTREVHLARRVEALHSFAGIIGRDAKMLEVFDLIRDVAGTAMPILIQGESGTGKELVAAAIHNEGPRAGKPFIAVNCGALPEGLLESELFGHVKGAFTGAIRDKKGRFELADGGTIFLDEIGDVSPAMQVRLLRVLQEGVIQRVGSETPLKIDVRIISATHRILSREIAAGRFREDLYYRLNVVPVFLPPLRERLHDIPLLVEHLLDRFLSEMGRPGAVSMSPEAMDVLLSYDWPGNVRELQNWLQYALVKCRGAIILPEHLPPPRLAPPRASQPATPAAPPAAPPARGGLTVVRVRDALAQTRGHRGRAARVLGVSRATLYRFFEAHPGAAEGAGGGGDHAASS